MNFNGWGNFEDLIRSYSNNNNNSSNNNTTTNNNTNNSNNNNNNNNTTTNNNNTNNNTNCNDIPPSPFQTIPPELFAIISEIIGNIIAGNIPFNVQNLIAQQQYFESGPGRYYDPKNYNISNPFCSNNSTNTNGNASSTSTSSSTSSSKSNDISIAKIENLEKQIQELTKELNEIKTLLKQK